ncbi:chlorophyll a/b-binding protein domain-containing protein [Pavlovales sp. CCMP2436]|nr:chlorophyll a/b-binding protein domain-containing protein [Pavlovales sp. CCMP2436]
MEQSKAVPFLPKPPLLDGTMAGGDFDPLNLAVSPSRLTFYREAEIRHCRLAMLAAANWPLAELLNKPLAKLIGLPAITDLTNGRAPSIPNGGLYEVNAVFWFVVLAIGALAEVGEINPLDSEARLAGDLGFDPLGLWPKMSTAEKRTMQEKELANGRLAMFAITAFVAEEFLSKNAIF